MKLWIQMNSKIKPIIYIYSICILAKGVQQTCKSYDSTWCISTQSVGFLRPSSHPSSSSSLTTNPDHPSVLPQAMLQQHIYLWIYVCPWKPHTWFGCGCVYVAICTCWKYKTGFQSHRWKSHLFAFSSHSSREEMGWTVEAKQHHQYITSRSYLVHNFQTITICSFKLSRPSRFCYLLTKRMERRNETTDDWLYVSTTKQPYESDGWLADWQRNEYCI